MNTLAHLSGQRARPTRYAGRNSSPVSVSTAPVPTSSGTEPLIFGDLQEIAQLFLGLSPEMRADAIIEMRRAIARVEDRAWAEDWAEG